jgi:hypothetical protein
VNRHEQTAADMLDTHSYSDLLLKKTSKPYLLDSGQHISQAGSVQTCITEVHEFQNKFHISVIPIYEEIQKLLSSGHLSVQVSPQFANTQDTRKCQTVGERSQVAKHEEATRIWEATHW